jgi:hypothetical protein
MRLLAYQQTSLRPYLGNVLRNFRWFYIQVPLGIIGSYSCVRVLTVSQFSFNLHGVPMRNPLVQDRVQIDVLDRNPETAAQLAAAIDAWMTTADFVTNSDLDSPPTNKPGTNIKINERGGLDFQTDPPVPVISLEYRLYNVLPS